MMTVITMGFPGGSDNQESAYNAGYLGSIPGSGRSPGEGNGYPLQYSCLENSMDRGVCWVTYSMVLQRDMTEQLSLSHRIMIIITIIKLKKRKICNIHMKLQLTAISNLCPHKDSSDSKWSQFTRCSELGLIVECALNKAGLHCRQILHGLSHQGSSLSSHSGILSWSLSWLWFILSGCGSILHELQWLEGADYHPFQVPI